MNVTCVLCSWYNRWKMEQLHGYFRFSAPKAGLLFIWMAAMDFVISFSMALRQEPEIHGGHETLPEVTRKRKLTTTSWSGKGWNPRSYWIESILCPKSKTLHDLQGAFCRLTHGHRTLFIISRQNALSFHEQCTFFIPHKFQPHSCARQQSNGLGPIQWNQNLEFLSASPKPTTGPVIFLPVFKCNVTTW